jgi:hypothetical protein
MCDYSAPWNKAVNRQGNFWLEAKALKKRSSENGSSYSCYQKYGSSFNLNQQILPLLGFPVQS